MWEGARVVLCQELCWELRASPGCEMFPDTQVCPRAPGHIQNAHPAIAQHLFWKGSFSWCQRKMWGARSALQCCTSGLFKCRCYPENSTLKSSNPALASAAEQISALRLHQGTDQPADLQTMYLLPLCHKYRQWWGKKIHYQIERFLCYWSPAVWTLIMESLYDIKLYFSLLLLKCPGLCRGTVWLPHTYFNMLGHPQTRGATWGNVVMDEIHCCAIL